MSHTSARRVVRKKARSTMPKRRGNRLSPPERPAYALRAVAVLVRGPKPATYQVRRAGRPDRMLVDRGPGEVSRNRTMWPMVPLQLKRGSTPVVARGNRTWPMIQMRNSGPGCAVAMRESQVQYARRAIDGK